MQKALITLVFISLIILYALQWHENKQLQETIKIYEGVVGKYATELQTCSYEYANAMARLAKCREARECLKFRYSH